MDFVCGLLYFSAGCPWLWGHFISITLQKKTSDSIADDYYRQQSTSSTSFSRPSPHQAPQQAQQTHRPKANDRCDLHHQWHRCPELLKAMDGVNYIADHTRKEEESTKVRSVNRSLILRSSGPISTPLELHLALVWNSFVSLGIGISYLYQ